MKVFSGVRPTGNIHIGNYLGAIKNWVELQKKHDCVFCIVDWHALTTPYDPEKLDDYIEETALAYLGTGINPEKSIFFLQSQVKEHLELTWLLGTITPVGELTRMTQYKEKSEELESPKAGLLNYPVLMAADILLYDAEGVPVGEDQVQHVELTRTLARKFNSRFGKTLRVPKALTPEIGARIMSLSNPEKKMSKSGDPKGCIGLFEKPDSIKEKVMSAVTDPGREIKYNPEKKPGISNLITIYALFNNEKIEGVEKKFQKANYSEFKESLNTLLVDSLAKFRKIKEETTTEEIKNTLRKGGKKARTLAQNKMREVKGKMGLTWPS